MKKLAFASIFSVISICALSQSVLAESHASQYLTAEMAGRILGTSVEPSPINNQPDAKTGQSWTSNAHYLGKVTTGSQPTIGLFIRHSATKEEAKQLFARSKASENGEPVPSLGDAAFRIKTPSKLNVLKGSNWLIINVGSFSKPDLPGQEKVAREILTKLPSN